MWIRQIVLILLSTALLWGTEGCSSEESPKAESPESSAEQVRILDASEPALESNVEMPPELAPMPKGAGLSDLQPAALKKYPTNCRLTSSRAKKVWERQWSLLSFARTIK